MLIFYPCNLIDSNDPVVEPLFCHVTEKCVDGNSTCLEGIDEHPGHHHEEIVHVQP